MKKLVLIIGLIANYAVAQCVAPLITDFECDPPSQVLPPTVVTIENAFSGGINTSPNIGQYTDDGTMPFDALIIDYGSAIDLSTDNIFQLKLYTENSIQILAKIEGGTSPAVEIFSDFSQENTWQELTFDFSASADGNFTRIALFFNPNVTTGTTTDLYYIDDLTWTNSEVLNTVNFSKKSELIVYSKSKGQLSILSGSPVNEVVLMDLAGSISLRNTVLNQKEVNLNVSGLSPGIYFARVGSGKTVQSKKIMIK